MAGIWIQSINAPGCEQRHHTTTRTERGQERSLRLQVDFAGVAYAAIEERVRQLREIAANPALAAVVYLQDDEEPINTGLYRLDTVEAPRAPGTVRFRPLTIDLTRLGGSGAGGNVERTLRAAPTLASNSFSITQDLRYALPAGATALTSPGGRERTGSDGMMRIQTTSGDRYVLNAADASRGECKVWDTRGDATEANWQRVWGPDHSFLSPGHLVIENTLVRFRVATTNLSAHTIEVYSGGWQMVTSATKGDGLDVAGAGLVAPFDHAVIDELSPWRVVVTYTTRRSSGPEVVTKRLTLERGKRLAQVEVTLNSAATILIGALAGGRYVMTRTAARDTASETASAQLATLTDNWVASWDAAETAMAVGACRTALDVLANSNAEGGGFQFRGTPVTSLRCYLGGIPWSTARDVAEAEAGTLVGTASLAAGYSGGSGSGNNAVLLDALNEGVHWSGTLAVLQDMPGTRVLAAFRAGSASTNSGDVLTFSLYDGTSHVATVTKAGNQFAAASTWEWILVELGSYAGPTSLHPYVRKTAHATTGSMMVDQVLYIVLNGGTGDERVRDVAHQALTDVRLWEAVSRVVF